MNEDEWIVRVEHLLVSSAQTCREVSSRLTCMASSSRKASPAVRALVEDKHWISNVNRYGDVLPSAPHHCRDARRDARDEFPNLIRMSAAKDEYLLDLAQAQTLQCPRQ